MKKCAMMFTVGLALIVSVSAFGAIHNIDVGDFYFSPTGTIVTPGDTVRWTLQSGVHQVRADTSTSSPKFWDSGPLTVPGQTFDIVFTYGDGPGPFPYHCALHPLTMQDTIFTSDLCYAVGDIDGDGMALTVTDLIVLIHIVNGDSVPPLTNLYQADLNGDCTIDAGDVETLGCYFIFGLSCFPEFPVPTCCYPDTVRGACCLPDSCSPRSEANCAGLGGIYYGNGSVCSLNDPCCCVGVRGNVDFDPNDQVNIADLTTLVTYLFIGDVLECYEEGNVNGELEIAIDDLTYLVDYLFRGGNPPAPCHP